MMIITRGFQKIAFLMEETGECGEQEPCLQGLGSRLV
jgi:hypothetical protein